MGGQSERASSVESSPSVGLFFSSIKTVINFHLLETVGAPLIYYAAATPEPSVETF
jgi:hypothetical protein